MSSSVSASVRNLTVCIYCEGRRADPKFTDEHIWPQALGGDFCPPIFRTNQVCSRCNSLAGQWVDRAFLRNFFTSNERVRTSFQFLDPDKPSAASLIYMGLDIEIPLQEGEVCERWLGPSGESIYHVHQQDDDRWSTLAGGDFLKRRKDPGRVYFGLTGHSMYWFYTVIQTILRFFPGIKPRCLAYIDGLPPDWPILQADQTPISDAERRQIDWIRERPKGPQNHKLAIDLGYADRFLAKVTLGLTHTILGPAATFSAYGDELRKLLWCSDYSKRSEISVLGTGPWKDDFFDGVRQFITVEGVWSLFLSALEDKFFLALGTPAGKIMTMVMSDDPGLWRSPNVDNHVNGSLYLIVPQRQRVFGPVPIAAAIAHRQGLARYPALVDLEAMRTGLATLPDRERPPADA